MRKIAVTIIITAIFPFAALAQNRNGNPPEALTVEEVVDTVFFRLPEEITNEYLDSVKLGSDKTINDYSLIGFHGGVVFNRSWFNPTRDTKFFMNKPVFGLSYTLHGKLFGFMPYFGMELGFQHNYEGYEFKLDEENKTIANISGATKVLYEVWEVPFLMVGHADLNDNFKLLAKVGIYGGYRENIHRETIIERLVPTVEEIQDKFLDTDIRLTYGLQAAAGFGIMLSPFEFHVTAGLKWGWGSYFQPDYYNKYYYRFAYPLDVMVTAGIYYQLTPRRGYTKKQLRHYAKKIVENE